METRAIRVKRLAMRSMRRGIKEMDLILSAYASARLADMSDAELDRFEALLAENDHDLLGWISGGPGAPAPISGLLADIASFASGLTRPA
jgi:antitoxin CptB